MTIELDSTLAQAEVLFLSFAQTIADFDRKQSEATDKKRDGLRQRGAPASSGSPAPGISDELRELLETGR